MARPIRIFALPIAVAISLALGSRDGFAREFLHRGPPVGFQVGGFGAAEFGYLRPHEILVKGQQTPPDTFVTHVEGFLGVRWGTENISFQWAAWISKSDGDVGERNDFDFAQMTWRPTDWLRLDLGRFIFLPWEERAVLWENYYTTSSVTERAVYTGTPEGKNGLDLTLSLSDSVDLGAAILTEGALSGIRNSPADGTVANTFVTHLVVDGGGVLRLIGVGMFEAAKVSNDQWNTERTPESWLYSLTAKFRFDGEDGSFFKATVQARDTDAIFVDGQLIEPEEQVNTVAAALHIRFTGDTLIFEGEFSEAANIVEYDLQKDISYVRIGYDIPVAAGANFLWEFENVFDGKSSSQELSFALKQTF